MKKKTEEMTIIALLASLIAVTGAFKIPLGIPGAEFQLSAPIAVAIAAVFGFRRYIIAGVLASAVMLLLGVHNLLNVEISMVFRLVAGGIVALFGTSIPVLALAGPVGSAAARWVLSLTLGVSTVPLLLAALPGMVFTAITVWPLVKVMRRAKGGAVAYVKRASL
ncbi:hypothetical protein [Aneurinibacillus danicus]|uniref:Uncharacterized protein n=1 Tax=Aneurinibacillus danicus TaxID=267746 RepID=A0A511V704_9BACL|nr:hypothetical protein [Aneurinibacillus danicus]GEN34707.1 hypothetical protein ADA01nite_21670 [Aneurinibacillus danicus]